MISPIGEAKTSRAFTLIEILLVIVIIGIVLALASPNFSKAYSRFQLNKTADDLLECSRWAQAMAIGQERVYALSFASDHRSYQLIRVKNDDDSDSKDGFEPVHGALGRMHAVPDTVIIDMQKDRIEFNPDGTIDPAAIQLNSSGRKIVLSSSEVRGMMMKVDDE